MESIALSQLDSNAPIEPRALGCRVPLTAIQRRFWNYMIEASQRPLSLRMCAGAFRILGPLDCCLLQRSIEAVIQRHESLRTRFLLVDGVPTQHIDPRGPYELRIIDLSNLDDAELEAGRLVQDFLEQRVDLSTECVFDGRVWKLSDHEHVLILLIDHMVSDGASNAILNREIWTLYKQAEQGLPLSLPALPLQFSDYAVWQQRTYKSWMERHAAYWKEHLADARPLEIPTDTQSEDTKFPVGATAYIPLNGNLSDQLREAARREGTLLPVLVLTAYVIVLSHWCREQDLLIPFISHGRHRRTELESMIGYIANTLYLRLRVSSEQTLRNLRIQAQRELSTALYHQDFDRMQDIVPNCVSDAVFNWQQTYQPKSALGESAVPQWASHLQKTRIGASEPSERRLSADDEMRMLPLAVPYPHTLKFSPVFFDTKPGIHMTVDYRPDLLASRTIERFGRNLALALGWLTERPLSRIDTVLRDLDKDLKDGVQE